MNIKLNLIFAVVTILLITTACSPDTSSSPILDRAQPEERNYQIAPSVPVTGEQRYGNEDDLLVHPLKQFHSACASVNIQRQALCAEPEPNLRPGSIFLRGDAEFPAYSNQKMHSACVSTDIQRQAMCVE